MQLRALQQLAWNGAYQHIVRTAGADAREPLQRLAELRWWSGNGSLPGASPGGGGCRKECRYERT